MFADAACLTAKGIFAGTVGVQRLLKMFKKYDMKTTWFIPGHSLETFPEDMAAVRDAGHEIGLHGYSHENPVDMSLEQQRDVLDKTYKMLTEFTGKPPRGSVAPWYVLSSMLVFEMPKRWRWTLTRLCCAPFAGGNAARRADSCCSTTASNTTTA